MKITTFASGSKGNCHLLEYDTGKVLLECGLSIKEITKHLKYRFYGVSACCLSHYHADHSKSAVKIMECGIDLYCSIETAEFLGLKSHRLKVIDDLSWFTVGSLRVKPIVTNHDTPGSMAYLIENIESTERLLFATDTGAFQYKIPGMTRIVIECNYLESIIDELKPEENTRIKKTHMGLQDVLRFLEINDLSRVKEIRLIHLSDRNSDPDYFKSEVQKLTGIMVVIA